MRHALLLAVILVITFVYSESTLAGPDGIAEGAPVELAHWAKLIGDWSTTEEGLNQSGTGWDASKSADWNFYWSFDGWGIRDDYTSPAMSETVADESKRRRGTNLRIYNTTTKQWIMTWLTPTSAQPQNFTATSTIDEIVMSADDIDPQGNFRRITFFDMTDDSFDWKLEWSKDKEQWLEVYRIHGSRKQ
jgi:hypothetical protein